MCNRTLREDPVEILFCLFKRRTDQNFGGDMHTSKLPGLLKKEGGQDLIEWAFLAAFIAIVVVVILFAFQGPLLNIYQTVLDHLDFVNGSLLPSP